MIDLAALRSSFFLPGLVALAALGTAALASPACGGNVVVDGRASSSAGGGGAGGGSSSTSATGSVGGGSSTGTGASSFGGAGGAVGTGAGGAGAGGGCTVVQMPPLMVQLVCVVGTDCPAGNTISAQQMVSQELALCTPEGLDHCCGQAIFDAILCGPSPSDGDCCYVTATKTLICN